MATISLALVVDKIKNRVIFAEADKDFVDILFSFLTLPLGTVIGLLDKQSMVGCVDKLYQSVENMDTKYLETMACKTMLLRPKSEAEQIWEDLKINVNDLNPRIIYTCPRFECYFTTDTLYSSVSAARCQCGKEMDKVFQWNKRDSTDVTNGDGIFVKGGTRFIISDDLNVTAAFPMDDTMSFLRKHGITDTEALEKKTVDITRDKILALLKRLMLSSTPLTDVFLLDTMGCGYEKQEGDQLKRLTQIKLGDDSTAKSTSSIRVNILYDKLNKKVISAEAGEELVDVLFSFLTFPLGCIVKLLKRYSSVWCLDNLYRSVELLDASFGIKSEECKNLLLVPKLATHFGCSNQLLRVEEKPSQQGRAKGEDIVVVFARQVNPKLSGSGTESGGGYAKKSVRFLITDDMVVTTLSHVSGFDAIKQSKAPIHSLVKKEVELGEAEVANLLKACLISRTALTNVFNIKNREESQSCWPIYLIVIIYLVIMFFSLWCSK